MKKRFLSPNNKLERNIEIAERLLKDETPIAVIAEEFQLSKSRTRAVAESLFRKIIFYSDLKENEFPKHDIYRLTQVREHKEFWFRQLNKLKEEFKNECS